VTQNKNVSVYIYLAITQVL